MVVRERGKPVNTGFPAILPDNRGDNKPTTRWDFWLSPARRYLDLLRLLTGYPVKGGLPVVRPCAVFSPCLSRRQLL